MTDDYGNFIRSLVAPRRRKYPIKRDELGRSARRQAFDLFNEGHRPTQVERLKLVPVSLRTLLRYHQDWKRVRGRKPYRATRRILNKDPELAEAVIQNLAQNLGISPEEVLERMQRPWGLMQLLKGQVPDDRLQRAQSEIEDRLESALRLIRFTEICGKTPKEIKQIFKKLLFSVEKKNDRADGNDTDHHGLENEVKQ